MSTASEPIGGEASLLKNSLQLRLVHNATPPDWECYRLGETTSSEFDCAASGIAQSPSSLYNNEKESLLMLIRRSLLAPLAATFEENSDQIDGFLADPQSYHKLGPSLQNLFPTLGFIPDAVSQAECPIKFLQSETDFLINDNDSQLSGLDLAEMDETTTQKPPPTPEKVATRPQSFESPTAVSPPSLHRDTPSPSGAAEHSGESNSGGAQMTRLAYCQRIAESAIAKLALSSNIQELNAHINALRAQGGLHALDKEKRRVKFILRKYDLTYEKAFGQPPSRVEKEPMRIVYVYYRKVKMAIDKASTTEPTPAEPAPTEVQSASHTSHSSSANQTPLEELERKLEKMHAQKSVLAKRLQAFQEAFEKRNGRRIRYHRDIVEIDADYRKYKKLRAHVIQLTEVIQARKALLTARGDGRSSAT